MMRLELAGRTVTLKINFANFTQSPLSKSRPPHLRNRAKFEKLVEALLGPEFPPERPASGVDEALFVVSMAAFYRNTR